MNSQKAIVVMVAFVSCALVWMQCMESPARPDPRGMAYAPTASCRQCHSGLFDSSLLTAHHLASVEANAKSLLGSFSNPANTFVYNATETVVAEQRDSGFYQVLYTNGIATGTHRFDISFGVTHAQTSLYWLDDVAYELPISFYNTVQRWGASPGFSAGSPNFKRLIGRDCFECHSAYISNKKDATGNTGDYFSSAEQLEKMDKRSLIYGIDCQRCHGPAAQHIDFHQQNPSEKKGKFMVSIASLSRQQQLDLCAQCHAGNDRRKLKSRFEFRPGDNLSDFFLDAHAERTNKETDVHGNQFNQLAESRCFLQSNSLTCGTCHSPHANASGSSKLVYSQKCMQCHKEETKSFCSVNTHSALILKQNCIDCHMPKRSSEAISFQLPGSKTLSAYLLTTHRIAVYDTVSTLR